MKYQHKLAEELVPVLAAYTSQPAPPEGTSMQDAFRMALIAGANQSKISSTAELTVEDKFFTNSDQVAIQLRVYSPTNLGDALPCLYLDTRRWYHERFA